VPVPDGPVDASVLDEVAGRFHTEHRTLYGYDFSGDPTQQVEWVNLRVSGIGPIRRPEIQRHGGGGFEAHAPERLRTSATEAAAVAVVREASRPGCFDADQGYVATPVVQRSELGPGQVVTGPVIIEEFGSTVPVHPGFAVRVDEFLNLIVTRSES